MKIGRNVSMFAAGIGAVVVVTYLSTLGRLPHHIHPEAFVGFGVVAALLGFTAVDYRLRQRLFGR
jgi:hypothetical protein